MKLITCLLVMMTVTANAARFSIAHGSDWHVNHVCPSNNLQKTVTFLSTHTNDGDFNFVGLVLSGGVFDQWETNISSLALQSDVNLLTNALNTLVSNGIFCLPFPGRTDSDMTSTNNTWCEATEIFQSWTNTFPVGWYSNQMQRVPNLGYQGEAAVGDSRQICVTYTNGGIKLVFANYHPRFTNATTYASLSNQFLPQTLWISNRLAAFSTHLGVVSAPYMLSYEWGRPEITDRKFPRFDTTSDGTTYGQAGSGANFTNLGPSKLCWEQHLDACTNLLFVLSGHTRSLKKGHIIRKKSSGGVVDVISFDMQNQPTGGLLNLGAINVLTFDDVTKRVSVRTVNVDTGAIVQNGSTNIMRLVSGETNVFEHNWTVPFPSTVKLFRK